MIPFVEFASEFPSLSKIKETSFYLRNRQPNPENLHTYGINRGMWWWDESTGKCGSGNGAVQRRGGGRPSLNSVLWGTDNVTTETPRDQG